MCQLSCLLWPTVICPRVGTRQRWGEPHGPPSSGVGLGQPSPPRRFGFFFFFFRNSKQKSNLAQYVRAAGEQPGPVPASWCPFNPPVSLRLLPHILTVRTWPWAGCKWSWRAEPGWELAAQGPACMPLLADGDVPWGLSRASPQQREQRMPACPLLPCLCMREQQISPQISFLPPSPGPAALQKRWSWRAWLCHVKAGRLKTSPAEGVTSHLGALKDSM